MKKIIAAAAGLMMVGVMASSASAVENKFGGYWRTRAFTQIDMNGDGGGTMSRTDTRTRLYYTAIFNENFKFVNKFEFDAVWGDDGYGDIGTDGKVFEVKHSYADIKMGAVHAKIGAQGVAIARGFLFDDDFAGANIKINAGPVTIPVIWIKDVEGADESDIYAVDPTIKVGDGIAVNPYFVYHNIESQDYSDMFLGVDFDVKTDAFSGWGTLIYNFGEAQGIDNSAFLVAAGFGAGPVHGQAFYSTGQDDMAPGADREVFIPTPGASYYWAEIMGYGTFDNTASAGSPANKISNIYAGNIGFKVKPADKLTIGADVWYASLVEEATPGADTDLGVEFDFKATIGLMDNLKLDLIAAYLLAGDATGPDDPIEVGARLSLSF